MSTLAEVLVSGQGIERPFRCTEHEDHMASASVNVLKGVWFCFACHASGYVDKKRVAKLEELQIMMEPENIPRIYDDGFLELYDSPDYWLSRFPAWVCWSMGLGSDPFTGDATFPVHTGKGLLAGVGRRKLDPGDGPRYVYPRYWSAASSLFGAGGRYEPLQILVLVEGAADSTSCAEIGANAFAVYGSGVHLPQYELIARHNPDIVLIGFDMDEAGERAAKAAVSDMVGRYDIARVSWPGNDPAACSPEQRTEALMMAVRSSGYRHGERIKKDWDKRASTTSAKYQKYLEEQ